MGLWLELARVAAGANLAVLLVLGGVWLRNYRRHGASHTLAFLVFAAFLVVENLLWLYFYLVDPAFIGWFVGSTTGIQVGVALLCGLELVALAAVARITLL
jgi:hypothetical protein